MMYCRNCYQDLSQAPEPKCPACGRAFDPADERTYLPRPFPGPLRIVADVVLTTAVAAGVAFVVGLHQLARTSGH
jgi:hypothetical protein